MSFYEGCYHIKGNISPCCWQVAPSVEATVVGGAHVSASSQSLGPCHHGSFVCGLSWKHWGTWGGRRDELSRTPDCPVPPEWWILLWALMWDTKREHFLSTHLVIATWFFKSLYLQSFNLAPSRTPTNHPCFSPLPNSPWTSFPHPLFF